MLLPEPCILFTDPPPDLASPGAPDLDPHVDREKYEQVLDKAADTLAACGGTASQPPCGPAQACANARRALRRGRESVP